jgi:hypothetical protein
MSTAITRSARVRGPASLAMVKAMGNASSASVIVTAAAISTVRTTIVR